MPALDAMIVPELVMPPLKSETATVSPVAARAADEDAVQPGADGAGIGDAAAKAGYGRRPGARSTATDPDAPSARRHDPSRIGDASEECGNRQDVRAQGIIRADHDAGRGRGTADRNQPGIGDAAGEGRNCKRGSRKGDPAADDEYFRHCCRSCRNWRCRRQNWKSERAVAAVGGAAEPDSGSAIGRRHDQTGIGDAAAEAADTVTPPLPPTKMPARASPPVIVPELAMPPEKVEIVSGFPNSVWPTRMPLPPGRDHAGIADPPEKFAIVTPPKPPPTANANLAP